MAKRTKGFTLVELLVVVAIIALLVSILLPTLGRAQALAKQAICTNNLGVISKGWMMYAVQNNGYPPILPDIDINSTTVTWNDSLRMGQTCTAADLGAGAQQNLCLLVKIGALPWKIFICPSTKTSDADRSGSDRTYGLGETVGGTSKSYCSYALHAPYNRLGGNTNRCPLSPNMDSGIVIMGDRGPSGNAWYSLNQWSPNHPHDGESVLYAAGNVRFSKDKRADNDRNTSGWGNNNIYTGDRWDTTNWENPALIQNGWANPGSFAYSTKDTVLIWWYAAN